MGDSRGGTLLSGDPDEDYKGYILRTRAQSLNLSLGALVLPDVNF